jgi:hypothetical protein
LAVFLGVIAGAASALGVGTNLSGSASVSEQTTNTHSTGKPVSVRLDAYDPSIGFGGGDPTLALRSDDNSLSRLFHSDPIRLQAFGLPVVVARVRDGLSRAPPLA